MKKSPKKIIEILLRGSYVSKEDVARAKKIAHKRRQTVLKYLLNENIINKDIIGQAIAERYSMPYADLNSNLPGKEQVLKIPESIARQYRIVLYKEEDDSVIITTDKPRKRIIKEMIRELFPEKEIQVAYSLTEDVDAVLVYYLQDVRKAIEEVVTADERVAPKIVRVILESGLATNASDIHFEPERRRVLIRFRTDGVLRDVARVTHLQYANILNYIKVQGGIPVDKHFMALDGSMQMKREKETVDVRISIVPTVEGEKMVLRLLSYYVKKLSLRELGLSEEGRKTLEEAGRKPFGMILISGPTGSGKTTSLYALLDLINSSSINITTIEDPVEYKVSSISQIQVNRTSGLGFAKGLRAVIRQDPDVILVGEIRDRETAEIAINAALTGHLLMSTFHANNASTIIPRLLASGADPFLVSSTMDTLVGQRLVRRICEKCKRSTTVDMTKLIKKYPQLKGHFKEGEQTVYEGAGCGMCGEIGYTGRVALFEIIKVTEEIRDVIAKNPSAGEIWKVARKQGSVSMFEDGVEKVKNGVTTIHELLRVAEQPSDEK